MEFSDLVLQYAPWSFSKVGVIGTCELQFFKKYVQKKRETTASSQSKVGVVVHEALEMGVNDDDLSVDALIDSAAEKHALTTDEHARSREFIPPAEAFLGFLRRFCMLHGVTRRMVEYEAAILPDFTATAYTDPKALIRGKVDLGLVTGNNDLIIIDHKTGKRKPIDEHAAQLNVYRLFAAAHFPQIRGVQCAIHDVNTGKVDWDRPMTRQEIVSRLQPWLVTYLNKQHYALQALQETVVAGTEPTPKTGWQCSFCGFVDDCPVGTAEHKRREAERAAKATRSGARRGLKLVTDV